MVGLATDTIVDLSRRGGALKVIKLIFIILAADFSWYPGLPGRPLSRGCSTAFLPRGALPLSRNQCLCFAHVCAAGLSRSVEAGEGSLEGDGGVEGAPLFQRAGSLFPFNYKPTYTMLGCSVPRDS